MAGKWTTLNLGTVCTKIGSGATPRGGSEVYHASGPFALIRSQNIYNDGFHRDGLAFIDEDQATKLANVEVLPDDVLLNITGDSVARVCQVAPDVLPARVNQHVAIIRPDSRKLDSRFLRYLLASREMQAKLLSWAGSGGTRNAITKGMIESFDLIAPESIDEQRAIAHILGTLDDKIDLNRRMAATLEEMARAVFKERIVATGEVGNWDTATLGHIAEQSRAQVKAEELGSETPYIGLEHMPRRNIALTDWGSADGLASNKFAFRRGELLFGKLRPYFHKVGVAPLDGVCSTDIVVLRPKSDIYFGVVLGYVTSDEFVAFTNAGSTGTRMPRTNWAEMARYPVVVPPDDILRGYDSFIRPLIDRVIVGIHESHTLAALRDALLPKLISGDLRVKDAERFLKEAV